jgi:hypothetical protein
MATHQDGVPPPALSEPQPGCMDIVNDSLGMGNIEIDSNSRAAPRKQMSNLTLPNKKSDIRGASSNLVNSIVGAGIVGIPYALNQSGLVAGVLLLFSVSYFTGTFKSAIVLKILHVLRSRSQSTCACACACACTGRHQSFPGALNNIRVQVPVQVQVLYEPSRVSYSHLIFFLFLANV